MVGKSRLDFIRCRVPGGIARKIDPGNAAQNIFGVGQIRQLLGCGQSFRYLNSKEEPRRGIRQPASLLG